MDGEIINNISNCPLLEYSIAKAVLQNLPNIQQLNKVAQVCKSWNEIAKIIKKTRQQIYHPSNKSSHEDCTNIEEILSHIQSQPALCIAFLTHENYEDIPGPLPGGNINDNNSEPRFKQKKGRYTEYLLLQFIYHKLPKSCVILGGVSCGVVMSGPTFETTEIEDGSGYGLLLLPSIPGLITENFYLDKTNVRKAVQYFSQASSSQEDKLLELLNITNSEYIQCVLLFSSGMEYENTCIQGICQTLQEKKADIAIGGGFVEALVHPQVFDRTRECGVMGLVFSGLGVQAYSAVIPPEVISEIDIENVLKKMKMNLTPTKGRYKRRSVGFMFACVARGSHIHGRSDVESSLFRKHFPQTPLLGFFGNGEIGFNNWTSSSETFTHLSCKSSDIPSKRARKSFTHSYSTVFVIVSFPVE